MNIFLQTMAGRITLIGVFCRTSSTGDTSRKLNNCMQSIIITKDFSLRDHENKIIQWEYGDNKLSLKQINFENPVVNLDHILESESEKVDCGTLYKNLKRTSLGQRVKQIYLRAICNYAEKIQC